LYTSDSPALWVRARDRASVVIVKPLIVWYDALVILRYSVMLNNYHHRTKTIAVFIIIICLFHGGHAFADNSAVSGLAHVKLGNLYMKNNRNFMAINEYKQAVQNGVKNPEVFRSLAVNYYKLGLMDEAMVEMEKALTVSPESIFFHYDLGVIYMAKGKLEQAKHQFMEVLAQNPGSSYAYYYLGEIFYRMQGYDLAWLFARIAERLGHHGKDLLDKLYSVSQEPNVVPWEYPGDNLVIRQILVHSREAAESIVERIVSGELFEILATQYDTGNNSQRGGYLGSFQPLRFHSRIAEALHKEKLFSEPVILETGEGFHVLQRIVPFDFTHWENMLAASRTTETAESDGSLSEPRKRSGNYLVFVGAFREEQNAENTLQQVIALGYPGYRVTKDLPAKGKLHIVVAGKYGSLKEAREAGKGISEKGIDYYISKKN
jgi:cytochrome c-type biogenesis protein CcmH/NrfG